MSRASEAAAAAPPRPAAADERIARQSAVSRLLSRPEFGALAGTVLVFAFFAVTAGGTGMFAADGILNWSTVSAQLMILAVGAALLMIGGEFDLSVGSMIGFAGMMIAIPTLYFGFPMWASVVFAFAGAMFIGYLNGLGGGRGQRPRHAIRPRRAGRPIGRKKDHRRFEAAGRDVRAVANDQIELAAIAEHDGRHA